MPTQSASIPVHTGLQDCGGILVLYIMVDALSRLFGKGSKKAPASPTESPNSAPGASAAPGEEEGFTNVPRPGEDAAAWFGGAPQGPAAYPPLSQQDNSAALPYGIHPGGAPGTSEQRDPGGGAAAAYPSATLQSQTSVSQHVLDSVPFVLSPTLSLSGQGGAGLDRLLAEVENHLEATEALINNAAAQDFRLERSVVETETDISGTLSRLHAS